MHTRHLFSSALVASLLGIGFAVCPFLAEGAPSLLSPKDEVVRKYVEGCLSKPAKEPHCDKVKKEAIDILKEDLHTLGSSANHGYLLTILPMFKSDEVELRIAAADAIGMIGAHDQDLDLLAPLTNDPVPDVRRAVGQMLQQSKAPALSLLSRQSMSLLSQSGRTPETPADAGKYSMPVAPDSTYLFYASDPAIGRLSYVAGKGMDQTMAFFKSKAKRGPLKLEEFRKIYRDQLSDEYEVRQKVLAEANDARGKRMDALQKDPANQQAVLEQIMQMQGEMATQTIVEENDRYQSEFYESPTVLVLEERQIGQRSYPTRYVVLFQDKALRKPAYRLAWMTVPEDALKAVQEVSLKTHKQEEMKKKQEMAQDEMEKKKEDQAKKKFKKGQADLEKELGF